MPQLPNANRRWLMIGLCFAATGINYIDRTNLGVAATQIQKEFGLTNTTMGVVLGGFFWTYAIMQLPMGWLIDRLGAKKIYGFAVGWWSLFTMGTALGRGAGSLMVCRLMLGAGEAGGYPSNAKVTALWFPPKERGFATSLFDSGSRVGAALSFPIVSLLVAEFGWRRSFEITGGLGFLWLVAWLLWYRDPTPGEARELGTLAAGDPAAAEDPHPAMPWPALFRYRTVWAMMLGFSCLNFVIYFFITWFPAYLINERHFSLPKVGWLGSLPAFCAVGGGWLGGITSDALYRQGWSLTAARKTCLVGGMMLASSIGIAAFVPSTREALALLCLSYAGLAFTGASVWCLPADVAPSARYVASLGGIQNFAASLSGALTTAFTGTLLDRMHGSFALPLSIGGGVCVLGALIYLVFLPRLEPLKISIGR